MHINTHNVLCFKSFHYGTHINAFVALYISNIQNHIIKNTLKVNNKVCQNVDEKYN